MTQPKIVIEADYKQVTQSQAELEKTSKAIKNLQRLGDVTTNNKGMPNMSLYTRELQKNIALMERIATKGGMTGITPQQAQQAEQSWKKVLSGVTQYDKELAKVDAHITKLQARIGKLSAVGRDFSAPLSQLNHYSRARRHLEGSIDTYRNISYRGQQAAEDLKGAKTAPEEGQGGSKNGFVGRMGAMAAGALTIGTALAYLSRTRHTYVEAETGAESLQARGISGVGSGYGFNRMERQEQARSLHARTGWMSGGSRDALSRFATGTDTDASVGIGIMERMKNIGGDEQSGKKALGVLQDIAKKTGETPERVGKAVGSNLDMMAKAHGGTLNSDEVSKVYALTRLMQESGPQGRAAESYGLLKNAMKPTGDPATDIYQAKWMGLYDKDTLTDEGLLQYNKKKEAGLTDLETMTNFQDFIKNDPKSYARKIMMSANLFGSTEAAENMVPLIMKMGPQKAIEYMKDAKGNNFNPTTGTANTHMRDHRAKIMNSDIAVGGVVNPLFEDMENIAATTAKDVVDSGLPGKVIGGARKIIKEIHITNPLNKDPNEFPSTGIPIIQPQTILSAITDLVKELKALNINITGPNLKALPLDSETCRR